MSKRPKYRRVLLKLSGEALGDPNGGLDMKKVLSICRQVADLSREGIQLAIVVGGGNFIRGRDLTGSGLSEVAADTMGMLSTVLNGVALQDALENCGVATRLQTAIPMQAVAEPFIRRRCISHLEDDKVVVLAAGTGHPYFTTDTAAALRAREVEADVLLKATNVPGVYDDDPKVNPDAKLIKHLTYDEVLHKNLRVIDAAAISLCREGGLPVIVFDVTASGNIRKAVFGQRIGTTIEGG